MAALTSHDHSAYLEITLTHVEEDIGSTMILGVHVACTTEHRVRLNDRLTITKSDVHRLTEMLKAVSRNKGEAISFVNFTDGLIIDVDWRLRDYYRLSEDTISLTISIGFPLTYTVCCKMVAYISDVEAFARQLDGELASLAS